MVETNSTHGIILPCSRCKKEKPIEEFRKRANRPESGQRLGRNSFCFDCERTLAKNPRRRAMANERTKEFYQRLKKRDYKELRRRERSRNLKRKYGITIEEYDAVLKAQNGVCAICGGEPDGHHQRTEDGNILAKHFSIDHCHETGKIRGLLCSTCNKAIGCFQDDPALLRAAIKYLEYHNKKG